MIGNVSSSGVGSYINNLNKSSSNASKAMESISTGKKINTASDDPAGLVISSEMYSQLTSMSRAYQNTQEAYNMLSIAEGGLDGISSALTSMKGLTVAAGNTGINGDSQTGAYQAQMNNLLSTVNQITSSTSYGSESLLNGTKSVSSQPVYSDNSADIVDLNTSDVDIHTQASGQQNVSISYSGDIADQAEKASIETSFGSGATTLADAQSFALTGNDGSTNLSFEAGASIEDVVSEINKYSVDTGVEATTFNSGSEIRLTSQEYGSAESITLQQNQGDAFASEGSVATDSGQDLTVTVDGQEFTGDGLSVEVDTQNITGTLEFKALESDGSASGVAQTGYDEDVVIDATEREQASIGMEEGSQNLQLGAGAGGADRDAISLPNANLYNLGRVTVDGEEYSMQDLFSGGDAALDRNPDLAQKIINQAIDDVSTMRADIGAYQSNTLTATANSLEVAMENVTAANSAITDTDMAKSITEMTTQQILEKTGIFGVQKANEMATLRLSLLPQ